MSNHSETEFPKEFLNQLGPTKQFPEGKLTPEDEGEIKIGVICKDGKVVLHFGKPIAWIGFPPHQALELAKLLKERGLELAKDD